MSFWCSRNCDICSSRNKVLRDLKMHRIETITTFFSLYRERETNSTIVAKLTKRLFHFLNISMKLPLFVCFQKKSFFLINRSSHLINSEYLWLKFQMVTAEEIRYTKLCMSWSKMFVVGWLYLYCIVSCVCICRLYRGRVECLVCSFRCKAKVFRM